MKEKLKVLELFGGIGAPRKALQRLGIEHEVVDYVEIDKYAVKSYNAIYGTNYEPQDITEWNKNLDVDLVFHGSPCQDFSLAGKQAGGDKGSGTRSSLLYETVRIVSKLKPKYVIWENVKNVLSQKHRHNFDNYLSEMEQLGYTNYYQVLNAKDYGIPQNRERVFTISIRKDNPLVFGSLQAHASRRNDGICPTLTSAMGMGGGQTPVIIENKKFTFPPKQDLKLRLKDMLEDEVDEKYYLSEKMLSFFIRNSEEQKQKGNGFRFTPKDGSGTAKSITTLAGNRMDDNFVYVPEATKKGYVNNKYKEFIKEKGYVPNMFNPYNTQEIKDIAPTQSTQCGSTTSSATVLIKKNTKKGYKEAYIGDGINISSRMKYQRGNVQKESIQTITTSGGSDRGVVLNDLRIRKLTPKECWRLMGFNDVDFEKASQVNSNAQLYKQAGNSIVVNVLEEIFKELFKEDQQ